MSYFYEIYGLGIESDEPLPNLGAPLSSACETSDVLIRLNPQTPRPTLLTNLQWEPYPRGQTDESAYETSIAGTPNGSYFRLRYTYAERYATYILEGRGRAIWVESNPRRSDELFTEQVIQNLLLGRMWGILLRLRGLLCLHGNVVVARDKACAILGASSAGKSTLTTSFITRGAALLSEDKVVLRGDDGTFWAQPGAVRLRLLPDTLAAFQLDPHALERVSSFEDKRYVPLSEANPDAPVQTTQIPLRAVYILAPRENAFTAPRLEPLAPVNALLHILRQRFAAFELPPSQAADEYANLARLAQQLPVRMVHRPNDLGALPDTVNLILRDVEAQL